MLDGLPVITYVEVGQELDPPMMFSMERGVSTMPSYDQYWVG